jgi:hypothetical protein
MPIWVFPTLVEEIDNQEESTHRNIGKNDEEAQDTCLAFDMVMVYPVDPHYFVCAF